MDSLSVDSLSVPLTVIIHTSFRDLSAPHNRARASERLQRSFRVSAAYPSPLFALPSALQAGVCGPALPEQGLRRQSSLAAGAAAHSALPLSVRLRLLSLFRLRFLARSVVRFSLAGSAEGKGAEGREGSWPSTWFSRCGCQKWQRGLFVQPLFSDVRETPLGRPQSPAGDRLHARPFKRTGQACCPLASSLTNDLSLNHLTFTTSPQSFFHHVPS